MKLKPQDFHDAIYEQGPLAALWDDKPHRVVIYAKEEMDRLTALTKELAEALEWIDAEYENQDLNHEDFRIGAKARAHAALQKYKEQQ